MLITSDRLVYSTEYQKSADKFRRISIVCVAWHVFEFHKFHFLSVLQKEDS